MVQCIMEAEMTTMVKLPDKYIPLITTLNQYLKDRGLKKGWFVGESIKEKLERDNEQ